MRPHRRLDEPTPALGVGLRFGRVELDRRARASRRASWAACGRRKDGILAMLSNFTQRRQQMCGSVALTACPPSLSLGDHLAHGRLVWRR
jgi:hypothetical protein